MDKGNVALIEDSILVRVYYNVSHKRAHFADTFILFEARKPGHFRSGIHVAYCIVMQNAI